MKRTVALFAASFLLSACATRSPRAVEPPPPPSEACDPRLTAPLAVEPEVRGGVVQPVTSEERQALEAFLTSEAEARAWGREGWARAELARRACRPPRPTPLEPSRP